ncbi:uncharacterized protein FA14DRAFT_189171 [Meira miltonrushii]|uniref:Helicase ATP-binding domain-containing protein n=1 Tax=Meira miltonrushii TaxID=1280837 RepID=A0A316VC20_9BASI|nr:uncharacterized protein FA14DRAFT_189171 [Meira miltonrushii]PWN35179.1 hypothetical protein FA14DRAFT_189171 [Meira miltonrushii]
MTSSPLISGPDWQSFVQSATSKAGASGSNLAIPSTSSPPPLARHWGPNSLGGEALQTPVRSDVQRRNSNITDPIGSRPGSRADPGISPSHSSQYGVSANSSGTSLPSSANSSNKRLNSRPSAHAAAGVMAAANSAAARSRATSPAISSSDGHTSMMGLGTSYHQNSLRYDQASSSPSFITAKSNMPGMEGVFAASTGDSIFLGDHRGLAGTPKLVVEEPESNGRLASGADNDLPNSPSGDLTASFTGMMNRSNDAQRNGEGSNQFGQNSYTTRQAAPQPLRSESSSNLPSSSFSSSSLNLPNEALLSPSAASGPLSAFGVGMNGTQNTASNATPTNAGYPFPGGLSSPGANMSSMQSFGSFSDQSGITSPGVDGFRNTQSFGGGGAAAGSSDFDAQIMSSRIVQELMDRVMKTENGLRDVNRQIVGLNRNVGILLERTKHMSSHHHPMRSGSTPVNSGQGGAHIATEEVRALSAQVSMLSASMSQMLGQNMAMASPAGMPAGNAQGLNTPLAGLGLAGGTPQLGSTSTVTTPQLGTFPGTPAYANGSRFGGMSNMNNMSGDAALRISTNNNAMPHVDRNSRLSPRPGASPGPNNRRWSSMVPGTPDVSVGTGSQMTGGAMNPPDPSVIVTKWEHLNLHADLLRSILKYGLGPPNKIQQRALPFLLRGSDIIAQAPPTQERIASYVIPVLQLVLNVLRGEATLPSNMGVRGPMAIIISTTVDQATQAQRMAMGLGAALGIRVHIAAASSLDVAQEASALIQTQPQIVVGTPQKMMDLFNYLANNTKGAISLEDVRAVVLDEVDQLIARNLADHVSTLLRILPTPRVIQYGNSPSGSNTTQRPGLPPVSPGLPAFPGTSDNNGNNSGAIQVTNTDRQTAIFSNTVPQDVLNFAQSIHLRESVRVLVRREGGAVSNTNNSSGVAGSPMGGHSFGTAQSGTPGLSGHTGSQNTFNAANGPGSSISAVQPINALGASPANNHANPLSDPILSSLRGLRQYYLYVAVTTGGGATSPNPNVGSQMAHAIEMKLDVITDLLEDIDFGHAVVYTSSSSAHEAVTYKLASKGIEALGIHRDMASTTRQQVLAKYRSASTVSSTNYHAAGHSVVGAMGNQANESAALAALGGGNTNSNGSQRKKALVVHDVNVHPKDVHQVPLIVFYDLPKSVDDYKEKIACAASGGPNSRPSVCVNVVTGSGGPRGDIEMLRTLECHLGCKMAELPMNPAQILQF